jgi:hypothetical protein
MSRFWSETTVLASLVGLTLFGMAACGGDDGNGGGTGPPATATVRLELTDAPGDLETVWIDISQALLVGTGGNSLIRDASQPELFALHELDGTTAVLDERSGILPGTYGQLRIALRQVVIKTQAGEVYTRFAAQDPDGDPKTGDLTCVICNQTPEGLPVFIGGNGLALEAGDTKTIVIDFDAFRSFDRTEDGWDMDPAMGGVVKEDAGTVAGSVSPPGQLDPFPSTCGGNSTLEAFTPVLIDTDNQQATWSGRVDSEGNYEIDLVPPGDYEVSHVSTIEYEDEVLNVTASASPSVGNLTVETGQTTSLNFEITGGGCEAIESG